MAKRDRDMVEEARDEEREASEEGHRDTPEPAGERKRGGGMRHKRAHGGGLDSADEHRVDLKKHMHRKRGGHIGGERAKERPDRRARGGGMADTHPLTAAGSMSAPDYESQPPIPNGGGKGTDKSPYSGGGHRRPG